MRTVGLALLVASTGCNWFFGLNTTKLLTGDAIDAPPGHGQLTYWLSTSNPADEISFPPIEGATVQYGALDGELIDAGNGPGGFIINEPAGTPYRLVYTLADEQVPHEVQWGVTAEVRLTVPRIGRLARTPPVAGSGYSWTISTCTAGQATPCLPSGINSLIAFTTGVWMQGNASYTPSTNVVTFSSSTLQGLDGTIDQIDYANARDTFMLVHYDNATLTPTQTWKADGYMTPFTGSVGPLSTGTIVAESNPLQLYTRQAGDALVVRYQPQPIPTDLALSAALGSLYNSSTLAKTATGGALPNYVMPTMTQSGFGDLPKSVFLPLENDIDPIATGCGFFAWPWNPVVLPPDEIRPLAVVYRQYATRIVDAVTFTSGFEVVAGAVSKGMCSSGGGNPAVDPINIDIGIAQIPTLGGTKLDTDNTTVMLPAHSFTTLAFDIADGREANTSDCIVTLYKVGTAMALKPVRTVQVLAAARNEAHFPTDDFAASGKYVFEIVCRSGYPNATSGDYTVFSGLPQQTSQVFPGVFSVTLQ